MSKQPFPLATPEEVGIPSAAIEAFVNNVERSGFELHSLMVIRHGKLCAQGWWKPYAPEKLHNIHSYTKTFLATALGIAVSQGALSVEDDVLSFFPDEAPASPCENLKKMKVRHLLTMNTGHHTEPGIRGEKEFVRAFLAAPVDHAPGTWFCYNSNASHMIGRILHKATGKTFVEILKESLFDKMGFGDVECSRMADGFPAGGGGFALTTVDMAKLAQLYLNKGEWNGEQLVPRDWMQAAVLPHSDNSNGTHTPGREDWEAGYGYQMWMNEPLNSYRFDGAHGQEALICPEQDLAVVFTALVPNLPELLRLVWRLLLTSLSDTPLPDNPGGRKQLQDRLAALRLPEVTPGPASLLQGGVDGGRVTLRQNSLLPVGTFQLGGVVNAPAPGIQWLEAAFEPGALKLSIQTPEQLYVISAGMDGEARANRLSVGSENVEFLASARWTDQNVLSVAWRQMRVVQSTTLTITYHLDGADVSVRHLPSGREDCAKGYYAPKG